MSRLYGRGMENFARERHDEGQRLKKQHSERDGICVSCGRLAPCDDYETGETLVRRYGGFLDGTNEPDPDEPTLVRPYALVGPPPNQGRW